MQPFQERVITERDELETRLTKLDEFLEGTVFPTCSVAEQERLQNQSLVMHQYLDILNKRIDAFL